MTTRIPTGFCVCVAEGHPELCPNTPGRCAFKCAEYSAGKIKPAYPVPAIQRVVEIDETGVYWLISDGNPDEFGISWQYEFYVQTGDVFV